jgi:hypothetical protein
MKRILLVVTVALIVAAMVTVMAAPGVFAKGGTPPGPPNDGSGWIGDNKIGKHSNSPNDGNGKVN